MKNSMTVSIKTPCRENWQSFTSAEEGRFCPTCHKTVVDLSKMTERELLTYLTTRTTARCALMRKDQLATYDLTVPTRSRARFPFFIAAAASALLVLMSRAGYGQITQDKPAITVESVKEEPGNRAAKQPQLISVSGQVSDEFGQPLAGASILLQGTVIGTVADPDGYFKFPQQLQIGQTLLISFVGYETREYKVKDTGSDQVDIEIVMEAPIIMGELVVSEPYATETKRSVWSKIKSIF